MGTIFISYAEGTKPDLLESLKLSLEMQGHLVATHKDAGSADLLHMSGVVVVLWSEQSINSPQIRNEAFAIQQRQRVPFVQVLIGVDEPPPEFRDWHSHDLNGWSGFESEPAFSDLVDDILRRLPSSHTMAEVNATLGQGRVGGEQQSVRDDVQGLTSQPAPMFSSERFDADASAFAPRKLRRATPEIVRIFVHQPSDRRVVEMAAKASDASSAPAGASSRLGWVASGATVKVELDVQGGQAKALSIDQSWHGKVLEYVFLVEGYESSDVDRAVITARIFVDDAQIGLIAFVRPLSKSRERSKPSKSVVVREKFRRAKRAFLSYSSKDRETVAIVAGAYQRAGIVCFFDRMSLTGGEEWSPRLLKEIRRADLFHLFWSRNAAGSEWVVKETEHALQRRRSSWSKRPNITVQMLDGPPWAPHPPHLDAINFDDFLRAAVVGYARGEG